MNLRPSGYEPDELPSCSTPRLFRKDKGMGYSPLCQVRGVTVTGQSEEIIGMEMYHKHFCATHYRGGLTLLTNPIVGILA